MPGQTQGSSGPSRAGATQSARTLNDDQISAAVAQGLGINIDQLAETVGKMEHNMREEWTSLTNKASEFYNKYVNASTTSQASRQ